jgi:hypothetical protein
VVDTTTRVHRQVVEAGRLHQARVGQRDVAGIEAGPQLGRKQARHASSHRAQQLLELLGLLQ